MPWKFPAFWQHLALPAQSLDAPVRGDGHVRITGRGLYAQLRYALESVMVVGPILVSAVATELICFVFLPHHPTLWGKPSPCRGCGSTPVSSWPHVLGTLEPWGKSPFHWRTLTTEFSGSVTKTSAGEGPGGPRCISLELQSIWAIGVWCWAVPATWGTGVQTPSVLARAKWGLTFCFCLSLANWIFPFSSDLYIQDSSRIITASSEARNKSSDWLQVFDEESWCYLLVVLVLLGQDAELMSPSCLWFPFWFGLVFWFFSFVWWGHNLATSFHLLSAKNQGFNETFHQQLKRELEPLWSLHCTASVITYLSADDRLNFAPIKSTGVFVVVVDFTGSRIEPYYIYKYIYKYIYDIYIILYV